MNALVVCANRYRNPLPVMPLGACLAAEAAERAGHRVSLLDLMFVPRPAEALKSALEAARPDLVGFSVRNIDNQDSQSPQSFYPDLQSLIGVVRRHTRAPVLLGGAAMGVMPEQLLRCTGADWAALGDGESVFPGVLNALADGSGARAVPGVGWLEGKKFLRAEPCCQRPLSACPAPDFPRWLDVRAYRSQLTPVPVQTKRGCPFRCVYCTYSGLGGSSYRLAPPGSVAEAVTRYAAAGMPHIEFVDSVFNAPYDHAMAICECLARVQHGALLQSLELSPATVDDSLLDAMERAGFNAIGITAESAAEPVLRGMRKGFSAQEVHRAADAVRRRRLPCLWIFLFGGPGETPDTVRETLRFASEEVRPGDVLFYNVGVRIYPGTELERMARAEGRLSLPADDMLAPVTYLSPALDAQWLAATLREFGSRHLNCINVDSLALSFVPALHRLAARVGVRPPLWRHTRLLRSVLRIFNRRY